MVREQFNDFEKLALQTFELNPAKLSMVEKYFTFRTIPILKR
jgi:hypothetical protein